MDSLEVANFLIPGYHILSVKRKNAFITSEAGKKFTEAVQNITDVWKRYKDSSPWWRPFIVDIETDLKRIKENAEATRAALLELIKDSPEYREVVAQIYLKVLPQICPNFGLLNREEQLQLSRMDICESLQQLVIIEQQIAEVKSEMFQQQGMYSRSSESLLDKLEELQQKKTRFTHHWREMFATCEETRALRASIAEQLERKRILSAEKRKQRLQTRAGKLAKFFTSRASEQLSTQLIQGYSNELEKQQPNFRELEKEVLGNFIFRIFQDSTNLPFNYLDLEDLNLLVAYSLAEQVLTDFEARSGGKFNLDGWLEYYAQELNRVLEESLKGRRVLRWKKLQTVAQGQTEILGSLSYLFKNGATERFKEFMNRLSDAHAFIQATGFSTQNESSFLAILDLYNYGRTANQIKEGKDILTSLLSPFRPLYEEYYNIAHYEKDPVLKIVRTVMPLIIVSLMIVLVAALLSSIVIPEIAFIVILIPTILLGLALASKYVTVKEGLYKEVRESYYGGAFEIPEYQVNARMIHSFGGEEPAKTVRKIYIQELQRCDALERSFHERHGLLTNDELEARKANLLLRHTLALEWYDIHDNVDSLGCDKVPQIAFNRLLEIGRRDYQNFEDALAEEFPKLHQQVRDIIREIKESLSSEEASREQEERPQEEAPVTSAGTQETTRMNHFRSNYAPTLFKPVKSLACHERLKTLVASAETVGMAI
nr:hypothetical protein [Legionella jordanis]